MAVVKPVIFQIVGYQNSGKTTMTTRLIKALSSMGLKTATIKHHGHAGRLEVPGEKDTDKHLSAGAIASIVEGQGRLILQTENRSSSLLDQIHLIKHFQADVILIEGYKLEHFPKLVLIRNQQDLELLEKLVNVKMIMYWSRELEGILHDATSTPAFSINDEKALGTVAQAIWDCAKLES